ncbi:MAG: cupin domain-containing protein [Steroidobacteraceae bacterium]
MGTEIIPVTIQGAGEASRPAADRLIDGDPVQHAWNAFSDASERFHVGHWSSTRGLWRVRYTECELCVLTAGRVELVSEAGARMNFGPGDAFVVPAGFAGTWAVLEDCTKIYAIFIPQP